MPLGRRRRVRRRRTAMVVGGAYAVHKHHQHQEEDAQGYDDEQYDDEQAPSEEAAPTAGDSIAQLTQLKSLLDSGVLTQDEFDAEKQKILGT